MNISTSGRSIGNYYIYTKISNGTHTRYYYSKARLTITSPGAQPTAINLTCNVSDSPVAPNYPVTISGTANYNNSAGPVQAGTVNITVGGQTWTASISSGNYSQIIYAPFSPGAYTVSCNALDGLGRAGSASGSLSVQSNGDTSGYTIDAFLTCKNADDDDPFIYHDEIDAFGSDDATFYVWWQIGSLSDQHTVKLKLYRPDGVFYDETTQTINEERQSHNWWRGWSSWYINGYDIADIEGRWKIKLYIDGGYKRSIYFTLRYEFKEHRMVKDHQTSDPYDPIGETYTFKQTDQKAETWCKLDKVSNPLDMKWIFYEPNGAQYGTPSTYSSTDPNASGYDYWDWYKFWGSINIQGNSAANKCGDWRVEVCIKDCWGNWDLEYTDHFRIIEAPPQSPSCTVTAAPAFPVETQDCTLTISATDNTYLKSVTLYWDVDGTQHSQTWSDINLDGMYIDKTTSAAPTTSPTAYIYCGNNPPYATPRSIKVIWNIASSNLAGQVTAVFRVWAEDEGGSSTVKVNGVDAGAMTVSAGYGWAQLAFPSSLLHAGNNDIEIWNPSSNVMRVASDGPGVDNFGPITSYYICDNGGSAADIGPDYGGIYAELQLSGAAAAFQQSHLLDPLKVGANVEYWGIATDTSGNSFESAHQKIVVAPAPTPVVPTGVTASDGTLGGRVRVSWNSVNYATSYELWRYTSDNSSLATQIADSVTSVYYYDTIVAMNQTNYYWVKAKNASGTSDFSLSDSGWRTGASCETGIGIYWQTAWGAYDHSATNLTGTINNLLDGYSATWQLVYAGADNVIDPPDLNNGANGYVSGDDIVLAVRTIPQGGGIAPEDGTTWDHYMQPSDGYTAYVNTCWSVPGYVYQRVYEGPPLPGGWYYDSPLYSYRTDYNGDPTWPPPDAFFPEANPWVEGFQPNKRIASNPPSIGPLVFEISTGDFSFSVPSGYVLNNVQGSDTVLLGGELIWSNLISGVDYLVSSGVVTVVTSGSGIPLQRLIRIYITPQ